MLLLIDNYDSFTYNIVHAFEQLREKVRVVRNDSLSAEECFALSPDYLVIGPGPGNGTNAGISKECVRKGRGKLPILGICLGHQLIGELFGGKIVRASRIMHGKTSPIMHTGEGLFREMSQGFLAARYHSLILDKETFPKDLQITAQTDSGEIMGFCHKEEPIFGLQFHPESIASSGGERLFGNFLLVSIQRRMLSI